MCAEVYFGMNSFSVESFMATLAIIGVVIIISALLSGLNAAAEAEAK